MTHKSRIYAPVETNPLPGHSCNIDLRLNCGSELTGARLTHLDRLAWIGGDKFFILWIGQRIAESQIKSWRLS